MQCIAVHRACNKQLCRVHRINRGLNIVRVELEAQCVYQNGLDAHHQLGERHKLSQEHSTCSNNPYRP